MYDGPSISKLEVHRVRKLERMIHSKYRRYTMNRRPLNTDLDRRQLVTGLCAVGSLACLGCSRMAFAAGEEEASAHKFAADSGMSYEEVFKHAYVNSFIPTMRVLAERIGIDSIQSASSEAAAKGIRQMAKALRSHTIADWVMPLKNPNRLWQHVLTYEIVEDTEDAFEVRITECLWAKTFRDADAADLGYACVCHADYAMAQAFNPKMHMIRDKTLMQGCTHCNHRWEMKT
jgi:hypothetical protein